IVGNLLPIGIWEAQLLVRKMGCEGIYENILENIEQKMITQHFGTEIYAILI
ncbi:8546_t:CDS:2, partial [Gigaspora rosea]